MSLVHVFDLGNVLIFVHEERFLDRLRASCRPAAPVEEAFREHYEGARVDRGGDFESLHPLLVRDLGLTLSPAELRLAWQDIFSLNPPMVEFVRALPRPRFMLSNTNAPHVGRIGEQWPELFPLFDECVFSHEVGMRKPDPAIFRHVESLSGRPAAEHVFVDDLPELVAGARAVGWEAIQFRGVEDCRRRLVELGGG
jgi:HAD superfamily hydrolase (TIGR01509 family)